MTHALTRRVFLKSLAATTALAVPLASLATASPAVAAASTAAAQSSGQPVQIDLLTWFWYEPGRQDAWRAMVQKFHDSQNDVRINEAGAPFDDFNNRLVVQASAGQIDADLVTLTPELAPRVIKAGMLEPLDDVATAGGFLDQIRPGVRNWLTMNNQLYGFDTVTVAFGLGYLQNLLSQDNVQVPTTVDEFVAAASTLTHKPDQFGYWCSHRVVDAADWWFRFQLFVLPWDGKWADGNQALVTEPPVINAINMFKQLYDSAIPQGTDSVTYAKLMSAQKIALTTDVSALGNVIKAENADTFAQFRSAPVPWPSQKSIARVHPIGVVAASDKKDASKAFLSWLYQPENYAELTSRCLDLIPMYPINLQSFQDYQAQQAWAQGYIAMQNNYISPTDNLGDFVGVSNEFGQIVVKHIEAVLTANKKPEDEMAAAQKELDALAQRIQ
jgi:ABC-type glycerol-3-phosphate transport system substrate-binding protein